MPVIIVNSTAEYNSHISSEHPTVSLFTADWAEQCKQVQSALDDLSQTLSENIKFIALDAEKFPEISAKHQIDAVPTVIFFTKNTAIDRVDGVDISLITAKCRKLNETTSSAASKGITLEERLKSLINKAPLMIFMKGNRDAPRCGFSKQLIAIINETKLPYETFDILSDEEVRQGLKTYSDWPTYPQVYVKGELIGGLDIIKELLASNELESILKG